VVLLMRYVRRDLVGLGDLLLVVCVDFGEGDFVWPRQL